MIKPKLKQWLRPTWPISIALALFVCAFVMVRFRSDPTPKSTSLKIVAVPLTENLTPVSFDEKSESEDGLQVSLQPRLRRYENLVRLKPPVVSAPFSVEIKAAKKSTKAKSAKRSITKRSVKNKTTTTKPVVQKTRTPLDIFEAFAALAPSTPPVKAASQVLVLAPKLDAMADQGLTEAPIVEIVAEIPIESATVAETMQDVNLLQAKIEPGVELSSTVAEALAQSETETQTETPTRTDEGEEIEIIPRNSMLLGTYQKDNFTDIRQTLDAIKTETATIFAERDSEPKIPTLVAALEKNTQTLPLSSDELVESTEPEVSIQSETPAETRAETPKVDTIVSSVEPQMVPAPPVVTLPSNPATERAAFDVNREQGVGNIFGKLELEDTLDQEIEKTRGHIELHLELMSAGDRQAQDTRMLEFSYPSEDEFKIDAHTLRGNYRLMARVYRPKELRPVASIPYKEILHQKSKQRVRFYITKAIYDRYRNQPSVPGSSVVFTASIFEGASGDFRKPARIPNAVINVVNFPEWGTFFADAEGNVRIPRVPTQTELLLRVAADGFYDTHRVVPVFGGDTYGVLYLLSKEKVTTITQYFTRAAQETGKGIVMGRVFDPVTRVPKAEEKLSLLFRKGRALYFDSLPDILLPSTTSTGLFGFFNVVSSVRTVLREGNPWPYLMNVRPNNGYYAEFGRGGSKTLMGNVKDQVNDSIPSAVIRLAGNPESSVKVLEDGTFHLPKIDQPAGVLALEVESRDYPVSLYPIPWDPKEPERVRDLFLFDKGFVHENAKEFARQNWEKGTGAIFGGAEPSLFAGKKGCVRVELLDENGKPVEKKHGPFVWAGGNQKEDLVCLTKANPRYQFVNLASNAEYSVRWLDASGKPFRAHVLPVGVDRVTVSIN